MAVGKLRRLAATAPVPIYAAIGRDARRAVEDLSLNSKLAVVSTARHASLLLVAGEIREQDRVDLWRLHDQLPHPRATLWWRTAPGPDDVGEIIETRSDPGAALRSTYEKLLLGEKESEGDFLPNEPPAPWRGKGDHGQGGEGMMGGKPYGRPMAMTNDDLRDGLTLDAYTTSVGPFLSILPPGLKIEFALQGDVIQTATVQRAPFAQEAPQARPEPLRRMARLLRLLGLTGHAERFIRADREVEQGRRTDMQRLQRLLDWSGAFAAIPPGLGETGSGDVRSRLHGWWQEAVRQVGSAETMAAADDQQDIRPMADILRGLEWDEAMLVINSFDDKTLTRMCLVTTKKSEVQGDEG